MKSILYPPTIQVPLLQLSICESFPVHEWSISWGGGLSQDLNLNFTPFDPQVDEQVDQPLHEPQLLIISAIKHDMTPL